MLWGGLCKRDGPPGCRSPWCSCRSSAGPREVTITVEGLDCKEGRCVARLTRRDIRDGSIVSSFPQTMRLGPGKDGLVIEETGR